MPSGWEIVKLGQVCFTTSGGTPSRAQPNFYNGTIPWIKSGELDKGLILDSEEKITEDAIKNSSAKIFPKGTLLIALYGATIGKLAFLGVDSATNQAVCGIYKNEIINSKYLFQFLFYSKQHLVKQSIGGAQPNISQGILKNLEIPLAPFKEQERILEKLEELFSDLDKGIESLEKAQQRLKVYRNAVLKWAFEGKLTNEKNIKWIKLGEVLEKIEAGKSFKCDERPPSESEIGVLKVSAVTWMKYDESESKTIIEKDRVNKNYFVRKGDFLFSRANTLELIGAVVLVNTVSKKLMLSDKTLRFLFHSSIEKKYVLYYLRSKIGRNEIQKLSSGNQVSMRNIGQEKIKQITFPFLPLPKQQKIIREIESRLSVCDKIEETITESLLQAEALRLSIIKKAFEGKLVKQNPKDEPAAKLLERIRAEKKNNEPEEKEKIIKKKSQIA